MYEKPTTWERNIPMETTKTYFNSEIEGSVEAEAVSPDIEQPV